MQQAAALESDYYTRLGLAGDPFAVGAMPEFFFVGAQRRFLVQRAVHALYFSGAIVLMLGAEGSGKTRTLDEIEKELTGLTDICRIDATVLMNATEIRALLAGVIGLPTTVASGNAELVYALERVSPAAGDPQPVFIAIDAAQSLSIETLAECAALTASAGGRLRLLLAGDKGLVAAWEQAQAGVVEILELKLLDRHESEDYVRTKLQAAGYREEPPLSQIKFDELFAQSGGSFAAINALIPQLLQTQPESPSVVHRVKTLPLVHIGIAAVLLTVVIVLLLYRGGESQSADSVQLNSGAAQQSPNQNTQQSGSQKNKSEKNIVALALPIPTAPAASSVELAPSGSSKSDAMVPAASVTQAPPTAEPINTAPTAPAKITESVPTVASNKQNAEKAVAEKKTIVDEAGDKKVAATKKIVAEKSAPTGSTTPALNADESALLEFPSSQYVLQLMGAESRATVDKFAKGAGKGLKLYAYRTQLRGKPWFIVVTGPYSGKNAAQAGVAQLPEAVRKQQPWPRTLANVQADIRAHSGR